MRKIRLFIASSLDGYIARKFGDIDWLLTDADYGYTEFFAEIDTVLMGRKTYEVVKGFGDYPYKEKKGFVFSQTLQGQKDENVEFVGSHLENFINNLRQAEGDDIWLVGGGEMIHFFIKNHFLDELILAIHPILLGDGIPLIIQDPELEKNLKLQQVKTYESGLLQVFYQVENS